jgi:microsomal dipeptidase-like Zn-dependent dipeptidase
MGDRMIWMNCKFSRGILLCLWAVGCAIEALSLHAQTVSIVSATPNPVAPGQTLTVTLGLASGVNGSPTGCVLTLIPYGQGNVKSIVSDNLPPLLARIPIPQTMPLGSYGLEVNCNSITVPVPSLGPGENVSKWIGAGPTNVVVGGAPSVTGFGPSPTSSGQTVTVTGSTFGLTQGQSVVHLVGSGVADVYVTKATSWSNNSISFSLPEYASPGAYALEVETPYGTSAARPGFSVMPAFTGWVDLHAHPMSYLGFGGKLIYGALDVGSMLPPESPPPLGSCNTDSTATSEQEALGQENMVHGGYGTDNACGDTIRYAVIQGLEGQLTPSAVYPDSTYKTSGYQGPDPTPADFPTWPAWDDLVDQRMWVNWMQRAYNGGQRVMVALAVNSRLLGDMTRGPHDLADDDKSTGDLQIAQIQAFVARHSNFMQIAESSSDIQSIVSQNKMAIVLGVELDDIGSLTGSQPNSALIAEVDRLYGEGVRYIFPIHLVDNPIGGSAVYVALFDYANEYEQGSAYALTCSQPADDIGEVLNTAVPAELEAAEEAKLGKELPTPPSLACTTTGTGNMNTKGLTAAGIAAIQEMMNKHMLIDIDHMSQLSANATISLAQQHAGYLYPLFSGHNGIRTFSAGINQGSSERSLTAEQYQEIGKLHGMAGVGSAQLTADKWLAMYQQVTQNMGQSTGAGFGTDMDGMEFGMRPRCSAPLSSNGQCPSPISSVQYGTGTMSGCAAVPLLPISTEGNASWNYNSVGVAHYGMLPDFLQDVASMSGGCAVINNMNAGAYYFYETWRIAEGNESAIAPAPAAQPAPPQAPAACPGTQVLSASLFGGDLFGAEAPCVCGLKVAVNADGTCPSSSSSNSQPSTNTNNSNPGTSCPSECKFGCNAERICNLPPQQVKQNP